MQAMTSGMSDDQILQLFSASLKARTTDATLDSNKSKLGITDLDTPSQIDIYATDFDSKEKVQNIIKDYNKLQQDDGLITVTDANSLVKEVSTLLTDEDYRLWYGRHAVEVLHQNQGALSRLLQLLQPYLPQRSH